MIFLDIGSHNGQTLEEVTDPKYGFADIIAFEPMPVQFAQLEERFGGNRTVTLCNYGLSDQTAMLSVYGSNAICEASVYPTKADVDQSQVTECRFVEASTFFRAELPVEGETVIVKMNCEGSEVPILNNLIDSGEIWKITAMTFDLDIRRVAGHEHEADALLERLAGIGFDRFQVSGEAFIEGTHREKIADWLGKVL